MTIESIGQLLTRSWENESECFMYKMSKFLCNDQRYVFDQFLTFYKLDNIGMFDIVSKILSHNISLLWWNDQQHQNMKRQQQQHQIKSINMINDDLGLFELTPQINIPWVDWVYLITDELSCLLLDVFETILIYPQTLAITPKKQYDSMCGRRKRRMSKSSPLQSSHTGGRINISNPTVDVNGGIIHANGQDLKITLLSICKQAIIRKTKLNNITNQDTLSLLSQQKYWPIKLFDLENSEKLLIFSTDILEFTSLFYMFPRELLIIICDIIKINQTDRQELLLSVIEIDTLSDVKTNKKIRTTTTKTTTTSTDQPNVEKVTTVEEEEEDCSNNKSQQDYYSFINLSQLYDRILLFAKENNVTRAISDNLFRTLIRMLLEYYAISIILYRYYCEYTKSSQMALFNVLLNNRLLSKSSKQALLIENSLSDFIVTYEVLRIKSLELSMNDISEMQNIKMSPYEYQYEENMNVITYFRQFKILARSIKYFNVLSRLEHSFNGLDECWLMTKNFQNLISSLVYFTSNQSKSIINHLFKQDDRDMLSRYINNDRFTIEIGGQRTLRQLEFLSNKQVKELFTPSELFRILYNTIHSIKHQVATKFMEFSSVLSDMNATQSTKILMDSYTTFLCDDSYLKFYKVIAKLRIEKNIAHVTQNIKHTIKVFVNDVVFPFLEQHCSLDFSHVVDYDEKLTDDWIHRLSNIEEKIELDVNRNYVLYFILPRYQEISQIVEILENNNTGREKKNNIDKLKKMISYLETLFDIDK